MNFAPASVCSRALKSCTDPSFSSSLVFSSEMTLSRCRRCTVPAQSQQM